MPSEAWLCWAQDQRRNSSYCTMPSPLMSTLLAGSAVESVKTLSRGCRLWEFVFVMPIRAETYWNCVLSARRWPWHTANDLVSVYTTNLSQQWGSTSFITNEELFWNIVEWPEDELSKRRWWNHEHMMIHRVLLPYKVCKLLISCCWTCLAKCFFISLADRDECI